MSQDHTRLPPTRGKGQGLTSEALTYRVGHVERDFSDRFGDIDFPRGQKLYGDEWSFIVDDLTSDYRHNHDGWEATWPLELRIYRGGQEQARFAVECEFEPVFYARELDAPQPHPPGGNSHEG